MTSHDLCCWFTDSTKQAAAALPQSRSCGSSLNVNDNVTTTSDRDSVAFAASEMFSQSKEQQRKKESKSATALQSCCVCVCRWVRGRSRLEIFILEKCAVCEPPPLPPFLLHFPLHSSTPFPAHPAVLPSLTPPFPHSPHSGMAWNLIPPPPPTHCSSPFEGIQNNEILYALLPPLSVSPDTSRCTHWHPPLPEPPLKTPYSPHSPKNPSPTWQRLHTSTPATHWPKRWRCSDTHTHSHIRTNSDTCAPAAVPPPPPPSFSRTALWNQPAATVVPPIKALTSDAVVPSMTPFVRKRSYDLYLHWNKTLRLNSQPQSAKKKKTSLGFEIQWVDFWMVFQWNFKEFHSQGQ